MVPMSPKSACVFHFKVNLFPHFIMPGNRFSWEDNIKSERLIPSKKFCTESELVPRFMSAQQLFTSKNDWICQVRKNMKEIQLNLTDERIAHMSKEEFRKQIKIRVEKTAINYLKKLQSSHSKTSKLVCDGFKPAEYLHSPYLNKEEVQQLFKLRNHIQRKYVVQDLLFVSRISGTPSQVQCDCGQTQTIY